jgi:hypothetical protein
MHVSCFGSGDRLSVQAIGPSAPSACMEACARALIALCEARSTGQASGGPGSSQPSGTPSSPGSSQPSGEQQSGEGSGSGQRVQPKKMPRERALWICGEWVLPKKMPRP